MMCQVAVEFRFIGYEDMAGMVDSGAFREASRSWLISLSWIS